MSKITALQSLALGSHSSSAVCGRDAHHCMELMSKNVRCLAGVCATPMSLFPMLLKPVSLRISASSPTREGICRASRASRASSRICLGLCRLGDDWLFEIGVTIAGNVRKLGLRSSSLGNLAVETDRGLALAENEGEEQDEAGLKLGSVVLDESAEELESVFVLRRTASRCLTACARLMAFVHNLSLSTLSKGPTETAFIAGLTVDE